MQVFQKLSKDKAQLSSDYLTAVYRLPKIIRINGVNRQNRILTVKRLNLLRIVTVV